MKRLTCCCFLLLVPAAAIEPALGGDTTLVPWPHRADVRGGELRLTESSRIVAADKSLVPLAEVLAEEVRLITGLRASVVEGATPRAGDIALVFSSKLKGEAYDLTVGDHATAAGASYQGVALATATLLQALRVSDGRVSLPRMKVEDRPHFAYCGAMLDVARKPHSIDTLKQCVEVCRFYKIRYLHLHLTDENAWVFPSRAFPKLGTGNFAWAGGEKPAVYDLAALKKLVAYADARGVTLVPEIELPGHSGQLRGTLPELFGYRDEKGQTVTLGVINMVRDDTYEALDRLLGDVSDVFRSSPYIHLGCDEASLGGMEKMPEVKAFIAKHKLTGPADVFNAFLNRMHGIVAKHGKRTIVWEGAPFAPVPPPKDLIVMPWVGGGGSAGELVKQGYAVINPPWGTKAAYFDPHLVNGAQLRRDEPLLLGATSIVWESPEEQAVPFLRYTGALRNEPTWNPAAQRGHADFLRRLRATEPALDQVLHGFTLRADGLLDPLVYMRPDAVFDREVTLTLDTALRNGQLRYTLDGNEPTIRSTPYSSPLKLRDTTTVKARWFGEERDPRRHTFSRTYRKVPAVAHAAVGARVTLKPADPGYPGPGPQGLTDGLLADGDEAGSAGWIGWERGAEDAHVLIDLGTAKPIKGLAVHCLRAAGGIFLPTKVDFAVSENGRDFRSVATVTQQAGAAQRGWFRAEPADITARYLRVSLAAGGDWTFVDEVVVNAPLPGPTLRHAARGKPVTLAFPPAEVYALPGVGGLTDGHVARTADFLNPEWLGIEGKDLVATIDLGRAMEVREVGVHFLQQVRGGIYLPRTVDVLVSDDGKEFRQAATVRREPDGRPTFIETLRAQPRGVRGRYVRVVAHTNGQWLFADEVLVNPE